MVLLAVLGMIVLKRLTTNDFETATKTNDTLRRIITLPQSTLPNQISEWKQTGFNGPDPEDRPPNQKFLSHTWQFQTQTSSCLVAFDQSNWHDWHELTECYRSAGWTLKTRNLRPIAGQPDWPCVVATFSKDNLFATLVYSMSYRDGQPLAPLDLSAAEASGANWLARVQARTELGMQRRHADRNMLAVQFQVFSVGQAKHTAQQTSALIQLHKNTRKILSDETSRRTAAPAKAD